MFHFIEFKIYNQTIKAISNSTIAQFEMILMYLLYDFCDMGAFTRHEPVFVEINILYRILVDKQFKHILRESENFD